MAAEYEVPDAFQRYIRYLNARGDFNFMSKESEPFRALPGDVRVIEGESNEFSENEVKRIVKPYFINYEDKPVLNVFVRTNTDGEQQIMFQIPTEISNLEYLDKLVHIALPVALFPKGDPLSQGKGKLAALAKRRKTSAITLVVNPNEQYKFTTSNIKSDQIYRRQLKRDLSNMPIDHMFIQTNMTEEARVYVLLYDSNKESSDPRQLVCLFPSELTDNISTPFISLLSANHTIKDLSESGVSQVTQAVRAIINEDF